MCFAVVVFVMISIVWSSIGVSKGGQDKLSIWCANKSWEMKKMLEYWGNVMLWLQITSWLLKALGY